MAPAWLCVRGLQWWAGECQGAQNNQGQTGKDKASYLRGSDLRVHYSLAINHWLEAVRAQRCSCLDCLCRKERMWIWEP